MTLKTDINLTKNIKTYASGWGLMSGDIGDTLKNGEFFLDFTSMSKKFKTNQAYTMPAQTYSFRLSESTLTHTGGVFTVKCLDRHYLGDSQVYGLYFLNLDIIIGDFRSEEWARERSATKIIDEYTFTSTIPNWAYSSISAAAGKGIVCEIRGAAGKSVIPMEITSEVIGSSGNNNDLRLWCFAGGSFATTIEVAYPYITGGSDNKELDCYDIEIGDDGDIVGNNSIDTAILMSLFIDKRANKDEIIESGQRRGWFGNLFNDDKTYQVGSKLWLDSNQGRITDEILSNLIDKVIDCLSWMKTDGVIADIKVNASIYDITKIKLDLKFTIDENIIERNYILWENSEWL